MKKILLPLLLCISCSCGLAQEKSTDASTPTRSKDTTLLQQRMANEARASHGFYALLPYRHNYVLPFYYTQKPYYSEYEGQTPDNQRLTKSEVKAQFSIKVPIGGTMHLLSSGSDHFFLGYTQSMFWQFYATTKYFRETNYEPELFLNHSFNKNWMLTLGAEHQSNGQGGNPEIKKAMERTWNRAYFDLSYANDHWYFSAKPWLTFADKGAQDLYNPDILDYMGHGRAYISYVNKNQEVDLMLRNNIESGFKRGAVKLNYMFPIHQYIHGFVQIFSGYGQSLIEYNHYTNSIGIGFAIS